VVAVAVAVRAEESCTCAINQIAQALTFGRSYTSAGEDIVDREEQLSGGSNDCNLVILPPFQLCVEAAKVVVTRDSSISSLDEGPAQLR
jgi:hypothetical protein